MGAWRYEGVLLPEGEQGVVELGDGPGSPEPLPGSFAITGLVDAHCHFTVDVEEGEPFLADGAYARAGLGELSAAGVTLLRDVGGRREVTLDYARSSRAGLPRVLAAGRFHSTEERYFPRLYTPTAPEDLSDSVRAEIELGATWVKIITDFPHMAEGVVPQTSNVAPTYDEATLADAVSLAHELGARVAAHSTLSATALIEMGVDSLEHGNGLTEEDLGALGARGGAWTPTIGAVRALPPDAPARVRTIVAGLMEHYRHHLPLALDAGVTVMTGSDATVTVAEEVALLADHGLTVVQAIEAASTAAQRFLGIAAAGDLVTFAADPRDDPDVLREPVAVVVRGERIR